MSDKRKIFRVLDANLNRLREALRVIEEYCRFIGGRPAESRGLKKLRHSVAGIEDCFGIGTLLDNRDTGSDCFAEVNRPEELERGAGFQSLLAANFKRAQEACRVIEEYAKVAGGTAGVAVSGKAKKARFTLYAFEKELLGGTGEKGTRKGKSRAEADG